MKTRTVTLIEVDYSDLDEQVTKFLTSKEIDCGKSGYECVAEQEWSNDESHSFDVDGKVDKGSLKEIQKGEFGWQLRTILNWMASEGVVPKGTYKVDICW